MGALCFLSSVVARAHQNGSAMVSLPATGKCLARGLTPTHPRIGHLK